VSRPVRWLVAAGLSAPLLVVVLLGGRFWHSRDPEDRPRPGRTTTTTITGGRAPVITTAPTPPGTEPSPPANIVRPPASRVPAPEPDEDAYVPTPTPDPDRFPTRELPEEFPSRRVPLPDGRLYMVVRNQLVIAEVWELWFEVASVPGTLGRYRDVLGEAGWEINQVKERTDRAGPAGFAARHRNLLVHAWELSAGAIAVRVTAQA